MNSGKDKAQNSGASSLFMSNSTLFVSPKLNPKKSSTKTSAVANGLINKRYNPLSLLASSSVEDGGINPYDI